MSVEPVATPPTARVRRPTSTQRFGSSRRESHDATAFYQRFVAPELSTEEDVVRPRRYDCIDVRDARDMHTVESNSVALVVTSPPYFAGKEYEECLGVGGVPATYFDYLELLHDVFAESKRVLEPGGRLAVNVANLGRRPYRSLAGDVTVILQDLGLLLRGEIVWWKGRAAGGSCAWGTFQRPSNPVLRDVTERIVIASKGRFDRAIKPDRRERSGLPSMATISRDEFLEATTDLWEIAPESATRVGHPAPFPVALPQRLIELYTYEDDVVLDPFMGAGSTAVAAIRTGRHFIGFDTDSGYVERANERVDEERERLACGEDHGLNRTRVQLPAVAPVAGAPNVGATSEEAVVRAAREGRQAKEFAGIMLASCGFVDIRADVKVKDLGIELSYLASDLLGGQWAFDLSGGFTASQTGLRRMDNLWRALGKAAVLHVARDDLALVLLTTDGPVKRGAGQLAVEQLNGPGGAVVDLIQLTDSNGLDRLRSYAVHGRPAR